jgi:hypothetical protein
MPSPALSSRQQVHLVVPVVAEAAMGSPVSAAAVGLRVRFRAEWWVAVAVAEPVTTRASQAVASRQVARARSQEG